MESKKIKILTLCLVRKNDQVLLGVKKRGLGAGRWTGLGGKVEPGESIEEAIKREIFEESGITVLQVVKQGVLEFKFLGDPADYEIHVFSARDFKGEPAETNEIGPIAWFNISEIPYDKMWPDNRHWFQPLIAGKNLRGRFILGENDKIMDYNLREVEEL